MQLKLSYLFTFLLAVGLMMPATAQIETPAASPAAEVDQMVGLTEVEIEYARPGVKGRTIFSADGLVPYGKLWRTGANSATKISFSDVVSLGGQEVLAGDYALLTKPNATEWTIHLYQYDSGSWSSYREKTPDVVFTARPQRLNDRVETFTIAVNDIKNDMANIDLMWDHTKVSLPLKTVVDERVMASIQQVMNGPTASQYYQAATYYHDNGKDLKQAYEWVQKANAENPRYWMLRRQALIEADLGMFKQAVQTAKISLAAAQEAGNDDYVRMNQASIKEWMNK